MSFSYGQKVEVVQGFYRGYHAEIESKLLCGLLYWGWLKKPNAGSSSFLLPTFWFWQLRAIK